MPSKPTIRASPPLLLEKKEREEYLAYSNKIKKYNEQISEYEKILGGDLHDQQTTLATLIDPPPEDIPLVHMLIGLRYYEP